MANTAKGVTLCTKRDPELTLGKLSQLANQGQKSAMVPAIRLASAGATRPAARP